MLIDWFTVVAQALNFLILVWLLRRFAYRPILNAINAREQQIAAQVSAASTAQTIATAERETLRRQSAELQQHRAALLDQIAEEAKVVRLRLLEQARQDADAQRVRLLAALRVEQTELLRDIGNEVRTEVLEIAGKALRDLAHVALDEAMANVFLEHLRALSGADRASMNLIGADLRTAVVSSAFELTPDVRGRIQEAIGPLCGSGTHVEFAIETGLICGIELQAAGHKLAWSVGDYLVSLKTSIGQMLEAHARAVPTSVASLAAAIP